jgi:hypothetical protein
VPLTRCGPLAAWSNAFFAGHASLDQVVDAVTGDDARHSLSGLPGQTGASALHDAVVAWRRTGAPVRVALPVPGDVRGLSGPADFRAAALEAGEAALADGLGVVPRPVDRAPSSAPPTVAWTAFVLSPTVVSPALAPPPASEHLSVPDAQYDLVTAIRESATALAAADVARGRADVPAALQDARRAGERLNLPPGHPPDAVRLLAQAERMQAVLDLAFADPAGGAVDRGTVLLRDATLRDLAAAVRRARVVGYSAVA